MNGEENLLRKAVNASRRRQYLIDVLLDMDVESSADGTPTKELSLHELEVLHISKKYRFANSGVKS
ncbi:hypothetical protein [Pontibacillus salipaludis]|uniref:Fur-regulated basic protein A n=1 Tax=Pontibacillus salipaludis TaxID=1697394 RepID=A0ABQ1PI78_9BACI|nr:hypothetical protein [Pontibacillus salipaludis]GGC97710.1 hypothetical protein GCM10011389_01060 [Pontibacillus salipaludis]